MKSINDTYHTGVRKTGRQQIPNNRLKETDQTISFLFPHNVNV